MFDCGLILYMNEIPLLSLKIGGRRYKSKNSRDITIARDDKTHRLCIKVRVEGKNGELQGTYVMNKISGEALYLHSVDDSFEEMVAKLLLETTDRVRFESNTVVDHVRCNMVAMEASVEQAGRIRELLMKIRSETLPQCNLRLYESIPKWSLLLPWWLYSKKLRIIIQQLLIFYTIFNTFWALWQLYRHVDIIRETLEPAIILLQEVCHVHISYAMETIDIAMEHFSNFWWRFFAPLKVLVGPLWTVVCSQFPTVINPLLKLASLLYSIFGQILFPTLSLLVTVSISTTWLLWYVISTLLKPVGWLLWVTFSYILRPFFTTIQYFPGLAKTTVDPVKALVRTLLLNSFKSICNLLLWMAWLARIYKYTDSSKESTPYKDWERRIERRHTTDF